MIRLTAALLIVRMLAIGGPSLCQEGDGTIIEGRVYDIYEAVIPKVTILLEDVETHTVTNLKTDDEGHYRIVVRPGRYLLSQKPIVGFPIPYEHSSFSIYRGERVVINFRPRFPRAISDSIEGGHWIERYERGGRPYIHDSSLHRAVQTWAVHKRSSNPVRRNSAQGRCHRVQDICNSELRSVYRIR